MQSTLRSWIALVLLCLGCMAAMPAQAQNIVAPTDAASLPDSPGTAQTSASQPATPQTAPAAASGDPTQGKQTKRILGIIPNFRAVSANVKLPPQTVKEKFLGATEDSFDYSSFIFAGGLAGVSQARDSVPEFHQGAAGYGRYYWHTFVDQTSENYLVEFILPATFRQDPRYYTLGHGGFFKRTGYACSRVLITRTDAGNETFNVSEVVGSGAAAGISGTYYPPAYGTWTKTGQRWITNLGLDGATFIFKEFWPDINSKIFHQK